MLTSHARHYAAVIERVGPQLHGAGRPDRGTAQLAAMRTLQLELENIIQAFDNALDAGDEGCLRSIAAYLYRFLTIKGDAAQVRKIYSRLLETPASNDRKANQVELVARTGLAAALVRLGESEAARDMALSIAALAEALQDPRGHALSLRNLALIAQSQGNYSRARELHQQALDLWQDEGDGYARSLSLSGMGLAEYGLGQFAEAQEHFRTALANWRRYGDIFGEATELRNLGNIEAVQGSHDEAAELFKQALDLSRKLGSGSGETNAQLSLGYVQRRRGQHAEARQHLLQALGMAGELGDRQLQNAALGNLAALESELGELDLAREHFAQALLISTELGHEALAAFECILAAGVIAGLGQPADAAAVFAGGLQRLEAAGYALDSDERQLVDAAEASILEARQRLQLTDVDSQKWRARGRAMNFHEVLHLAINKLGAAPLPPR